MRCETWFPTTCFRIEYRRRYIDNVLPKLRERAAVALPRTSLNLPRTFIGLEHNLNKNKIKKLITIICYF
jgi:hypothetical protein